MRPILQIVRFLWASPYTFLGLTIGLLGLITGGRARVRGRIIEFHGGGVSWFLSKLPGRPYAMAITFGHTVLGQTGAALDICREHEMVHVRQYERWGPLMGPAYLLASLVLWLRGKDAYRDNPFERQAFEEVPENG
jgi:hypothetical protein